MSIVLFSFILFWSIILIPSFFTCGVSLLFVEEPDQKVSNSTSSEVLLVSLLLSISFDDEAFFSELTLSFLVFFFDSFFFLLSSSVSVNRSGISAFSKLFSHFFFFFFSEC